MAFSIAIMLARLQQFVVFSLLAVTIAWWSYFWFRGSPVWAIGGLVLVAFGYLATIAFEFVLLARSYEPQIAIRPSLLQLISAWWKEVLAAPLVFLWRQPFRSKAIADDLHHEDSPRHGVVLIHGFLCNRGIWNPWMERLRAARVRFVALSLEPVFGSIDDYVEQIENAVRRLEKATGRAPIIVAHSMGGLATRAWLVQFGGLKRVHRVVTVGTPHHGTAVARHAHTANSRQMRIGSEWIAALARGEPAATYKAFTCFWSRCDNIVFPTTSATLPGADNRQLDATPHVSMVYHPDVLAEVLRLVGDEHERDDRSRQAPA